MPRLWTKVSQQPSTISDGQQAVGDDVDPRRRAPHPALVARRYMRPRKPISATAPGDPAGDRRDPAVGVLADAHGARSRPAGCRGRARGRRSPPARRSGTAGWPSRARGGRAAGSSGSSTRTGRGGSATSAPPTNTVDRDVGEDDPEQDLAGAHRRASVPGITSGGRERLEPHELVRRPLAASLTARARSAARRARRSVSADGVEHVGVRAARARAGPGHELERRAMLAQHVLAAAGAAPRRRTRASPAGSRAARRALERQAGGAVEPLEAHERQPALAPVALAVEGQVQTAALVRGRRSRRSAAARSSGPAPPTSRRSARARAAAGDGGQLPRRPRQLVAAAEQLVVRVLQQQRAELVDACAAARVPAARLISRPPPSARRGSPTSSRCRARSPAPR